VPATRVVLVRHGLSAAVQSVDKATFPSSNQSAFCICR
jgi:hypothetical protein